MKTLKLLLTFVLILTCLLCAVSCEFLTSLGIGEHVHEYGTEWNYDDNNHWKLCSQDECNAETEKAAHTWGEPTVTEAEVGKEGSRVYTCTVCSATKKEIIPALEHNHVASREWISDKNEHWNSCEGCDAHLNKTAHVWDDGTVIVEATSGNKGTIRYRCVVCDRTKTEDIPALPAKMSEAEWKNLFIFDNVRVDLWFDVADITSSEGVLLIDGEYAEITSDGEAQITPTEQQISDFDFSNCYDAFNHIGNNVYFASKVTVTEEGTNMEFTDVTVIIINNKIDSISYSMDLFGMTCDFKYTFSEWGNVTVDIPSLDDETYFTALNSEKFYVYCMDVTEYDTDYNSTLTCYEFNGNFWNYTLYNEDETYTNEGETENAGIALNPFYSTLVSLNAYSFVYDAYYDGFAHVNPSLIDVDITEFVIRIRDGYLTEIYVIWSDGVEEIYEFYDWGNVTTELPTLTQEDYEAILDVDNFYNYTLDSISFDADYNYTMLTYIFDGDSYTVTRYINDNITTSSGVMENAGVVYNFALDILSQLSAEDFVYDEYDEAFALENPSELKSSIVHFFITIEDGYLTSVYIEYDDGSMDTFSLYDYGTSILESTDEIVLTENEYNKAIDPENFTNYVIDVYHYNNNYDLLEHDVYFIDEDNYHADFYVGDTGLLWNSSDDTCEDAGIWFNEVVPILWELEYSDFIYDSYVEAFVCTNEYIGEYSLIYLSILIEDGKITFAECVYESEYSAVYVMSEYGNVKI